MANLMKKKRGVLGQAVSAAAKQAKLGAQSVKGSIGKAVSGAVKGAGMMGGMLNPVANMGERMGAGMAKMMKNETFSRGPKEMGAMMGKKYRKLMGK